MTKEEVIEVFQSVVKTLGSEKAAAKLLHISPAYLNDILLGRRLPGRKSLACLGLEPITAYRWIKK